MRTLIITLLTLLVAAGSALAHPFWHEHRDHYRYDRGDYRYHYEHHYNRGHYEHRRHWNGFSWIWLDVWVWDDDEY